MGRPVGIAHLNFVMLLDRITQQSGASGERRARRRLGKAFEPKWVADADLFAENLARQVTYAMELARSAGQNQPPASELLQPDGRQTRTYHLECLFDARSDNADQH